MPLEGIQVENIDIMGVSFVDEEFVITDEQHISDISLYKC
jgi:hypothetical protein